MPGLHIFRKKAGRWQAKHGFWGPAYDRAESEEGSFEGAATSRRFDLLESKFFPFEDNRPIKDYSGISVTINRRQYTDLSKDDLLKIINEMLNN